MSVANAVVVNLVFRQLPLNDFSVARHSKRCFPEFGVAIVFEDVAMEVFVNFVLYLFELAHLQVVLVLKTRPSGRVSRFKKHTVFV